jgi:hypothetical protein
MSRYTNRQADPEVCFRVVHLGQDGHKGTPVTYYREQTVEIALGPKGDFENGNIGALTRRISTDRVVTALPPRRGKAKPPKGPKTPRVVELFSQLNRPPYRRSSGERHGGRNFTGSLGRTNPGTGRSG